MNKTFLILFLTFPQHLKAEGHVLINVQPDVPRQSAVPLRAAIPCSPWLNYEQWQKSLRKLYWSHTTSLHHIHCELGRMPGGTVRWQRHRKSCRRAQTLRASPPAHNGCDEVVCYYFWFILCSVGFLPHHILIQPLMAMSYGFSLLYESIRDFVAVIRLHVRHRVCLSSTHFYVYLWKTGMACCTEIMCCNRQYLNTTAGLWSMHNKW